MGLSRQATLLHRDGVRLRLFGGSSMRRVLLVLRLFAKISGRYSSLFPHKTDPCKGETQ